MRCMNSLHNLLGTRRRRELAKLGSAGELTAARARLDDARSRGYCSRVV